MKSRIVAACSAFLGIAVFVTAGLTIEDVFGVRFDTTYRVACAAVCLIMMGKSASGYPGQRWPWVAVSMALLTDVILFFTLLADQPASRGEIMYFALPNITVFLAARAASYPGTDVHARAVRGQLILGAILAAAFSAILLSMTLIPADVGH